MIRKVNKIKLWRWLTKTFVAIYTYAKIFFLQLYVKIISRYLVSKLRSGKLVAYWILILNPTLFGNVLIDKWIVIESIGWRATVSGKKCLGPNTAIVVLKALTNDGIRYNGGKRPGELRWTGGITQTQPSGYGNPISYTDYHIRLADPAEHQNLVEST